MRKIKASQIVVFVGLFGVAVALSALSAWVLLGPLPLGDFRGVVVSGAWFVLFYAYAICFYRLFLSMWPLHPGEISAGSRQEFVYHVYILFYLMLFYPVMRSGFMPTPLMRLFYLALGTRLGDNTYSQGILHDPPFIEIGQDSVVGQYALLIPHVIEGARLGHYPIKIGNHVTIGAHASVLSDVTIGDGAIVATGAVVRKGTRIGAGEIWGGVPAVKIGQAPSA